MESEDESSIQQHPKRSKPTMKDSILTTPCLPQELITEILLRVPVKPLLQFRCVSKSWLSLISSPQFIKNHLSVSVSNKECAYHMLILDLSGTKWNFKDCPVKSLFYESVTEPFELDYPIKDANKTIDIMGSCNGLIFLAHYSEYWLIWNPTIRKCKKLPAFRPSLKKKVYAMYGLGYDELRDDYKVVAIFYDCSGFDYVDAKIYSLKSDSWRSISYCEEMLNGSGSTRKMNLNAPGLFVNGKLHWDNISFGPNVCTGRNIISFDLADEKWEKVEKPSYGQGDSELCVGAFGNDLFVFSDYKGIQLDVWVMKEYGVKESWIKMFTIKYTNDKNLFPPFYMSNKGEILVVSGLTFMIYNPKDHSYRYSEVTNFDGCHGAEIYIESLVCPFSTEGKKNTTKRRLKKSDQIK